MVRQVQVVAILMIVNGMVISLMGLYLALVVPLLYGFILVGPAAKTATNSPDSTMLAVVGGLQCLVGLAVLTTAGLNIVAGIRSLKYRGRTLALVALFSNVAPLFTCYCAVLSLGVMIYGLIVFFHRDVAEAFARVADGLPPERVQRGWHPDDEADDEMEDEFPPPSDRPRGGDNIRRGPEDTYS